LVQNDVSFGEPIVTAGDMSTILAIDQGTTSTKAFVAHGDGSFRPIGTRTHRQILPRPGWVEHDPEELVAGITGLIDAAGRCDALGLANQGETVAAWDSLSKRPLHNAIVWQDERTRAEVERLRAAGVEALTLERAGSPLDPYFSASKLRWLYDHAAEARALHRQGRLRLGTSDAFFLDRLTGQAATDVSTASRTSLMNLQTLAWDEELCAAFAVPIECLPSIRPTTGDFSSIAKIPVRVSITDQQASLHGHGCRASGEVKITFGTGAFALGLTGGALVRGSGLATTCAWRIGNAPAQYALDGGILTAGAALDWARGIGLYGGFDELRAFAGPPAAARGLMFVPAQAGLACPYWDRSARGAWIGLELATGRLDLVRAILEGIALRAEQVLRAYAAAVGGLARVSIDGGLSRNDYFARFLAGAIGRPLLVAAVPDLTAWGVALLCRDTIGAPALALPEWKRIEPLDGIDDGVHARFADAVERTRGWANV
jgi:glycerol kinase